MVEKKSKLQISLESKGWKFLTNVDPTRENDYSGEDIFEISRISPLSDEELKNKYSEEGNRKARIENAYDILGNLIHPMRAIYVKY
jgi:hypothetical protein